MYRSHRKYFHKAICQSGTALHEWLIQPDPVGKSKKIAELLGFQGGSQIETLGKIFVKLRRKSFEISNLSFYRLFARRWRSECFPKVCKDHLKCRWETTRTAFVLQTVCRNRNGLYVVSWSMRLPLINNILAQRIPIQTTIGTDESTKFNQHASHGGLEFCRRHTQSCGHLQEIEGVWRRYRKINTSIIERTKSLAQSTRVTEIDRIDSQILFPRPENIEDIAQWSGTSWRWLSLCHCCTSLCWDAL